MKRGFPGGGMGGMNMNMIKQAQKMQQDMMKMQEELEEKEFTASSGGGAVEATVNGKNKVISIKISPDVVDPDDTEMLEDLVLAAINEAMRAADEGAASERKKITGGMSIPGLF